MIDPLLLPLATAENATYLLGAKPTWQNADKTCHVYHSLVNGVNTFAFEGTIDFAEWLQDFNPVEEIDPQIGPVHLASLTNVREVLPNIRTVLDAAGKPPCYLVGHSKGAREGPIAHAVLKALGYPIAAGYYFEPPKAGGVQLQTFLANETIVMTQTYNAHGSDIVTLVPDGPGWVQIRPLLRLPVPDNFSLANKHRMLGVITGINNLGAAHAV